MVMSWNLRLCLRILFIVSFVTFSKLRQGYQSYVNYERKGYKIDYS